MAMAWRSRKYEVLPALSVRRGELRRSLRTVTIAWMFGVVWMSLVSGAQFVALGRLLGFSEFHFGLLGALPYMATGGQLLATRLIERTGLQKHLFLVCATVSRLLWLVVAAIPLVVRVPSAWAVAMMIVVLAGVYFLDAMAVPAWFTWMGYLIPRRIRGRYFAFRNRLSQCVQIVVVILAGVVLDRSIRPGAGFTPAEQPLLLWTVCMVFAVAALFGALDILLFRRIREVLPSVYGPAGPPVVSRRRMMDAWGDRVFRHYAIYGAVFTFTISVSTWYFWRNCTQNLGFSNLATNVLFLVVTPVVGILSSPLWGRIIDRWGRRPVLILAGVGTAVGVVPWLLASPKLANPAFIVDGANWLARHVGALFGRSDWSWLSYEDPVSSYLIALCGVAVAGFSWTGLALAQTGVVLGFADGRGRSRYVAASSFLISIGGILGGLVGGTVTQAFSHLQSRPIILGPFVWNNWHLTFMLAIAGRLLALISLKGMPDPGSASVRNLLRFAGANIYNNFRTRAFSPLRAFGWRRWNRASRPDGRGGRPSEDADNDEETAGDPD